MKLRYKFEDIRSNLMHIDLTPSLDVCLNDLSCEEQRLLTQYIIEEQKSFIVPVTYIAQGKSRKHDMRNIQCFCYKHYGHYSYNCPRKLCNYCKKDRHIIKECPIRPPKQNATTFTTFVISSIVVHQNASTIIQQTTPTVFQQNAPTAVQTLTPEMVQQMIISAFSAFAFSGKSSLSWYFEHGLLTT